MYGNPPDSNCHNSFGIHHSCCLPAASLLQNMRKARLSFLLPFLLLLLFVYTLPVLNAEITISTCSLFSCLQTEALSRYLTTKAIFHTARWLKRKLRSELRIQVVHVHFTRLTSGGERRNISRLLSLSLLPLFLSLTSEDFFYSHVTLWWSQSRQRFVPFRQAQVFASVNCSNSLAEWYVVASLLFWPSKTRTHEVDARMSGSLFYNAFESRILRCNQIKLCVSDYLFIVQAHRTQHRVGRRLRQWFSLTIIKGIQSSTEKLFIWYARLFPLPA